MSNLIPVSRKEQYLSKIDGMTNKSPDKTYTKEEYFFSEILGEALHKPVLETRYEMYLAKIAGREIGIPYPETRLEYFLARAAGMDIETPTPITREEIFWSNYSAIVDFEVEGVPPLTFNAVAGSLKNYRIYGQTVDGESVGDRTGNLFYGEIEHGGFNNDGINLNEEPYYSRRIRSKQYISVIPNTVYSFSVSTALNIDLSISFYDKSDYTTKRIGYVNWSHGNTLTFTTATNCTYIRALLKTESDSDITPSDISNIMLNTGSTPLPYEPYGYKVPVTVSNGSDTLTTPIYLPEQIRKVGDEAEYIDYSEQKQHRVRKNLLPNTATSQTINGVEITINANGSVTCNGQATGVILFKFNSSFTLPVGEFVLTGCPTGGGNSSYRMYIQTDNLSPQKYYRDLGNGVTIDNTNAGTVYSARISITAGYSCNNLTFYPMIRLVSIEDDTYEPYIENTEVDVALPALPTLPGTNVLSVGTVVQPSKVYVKGEKRRE